MSTRILNTLTLIIGVMIVGFFLSSSRTPQGSNNVPRYHMTHYGGTVIFVYDAMTGKQKTVKYSDVKDGKSIKELLDE